MSSMDTEPSDSFSGIGDKSMDHSSHGNTAQAVDFSHASTIVGDTVTNGENAMEQKPPMDERAAARTSEHVSMNSEHGGNVRDVSETSFGRASAGPAMNIVADEESKDTTDEQKIELKDASSENTSEAVESEKHDSVAASAGSSPPPSSAAPDELHMDIDAKDDSEEGDSKKLTMASEDSSKNEADTLKAGGDDEHKMDTEEGEAEAEKEEKKEVVDTSDKAEKDKADAEKKEEGTAKRVLPKWMVQDADAPPSPKEEPEEKGEAAPATENAPATGGGGRGRGRGRRGRDTTRAVAKPHNEAAAAAEQPQPESLSSGRPRRSTRSNVDYAHPDVATVVAEQEDLENETTIPGDIGTDLALSHRKQDLSSKLEPRRLQQKVTRNRGRGRGRGRGGRTGGRKRAAADSDDGEDSDSEYGKHKKQKRATGCSTRGRGRGRGRGRPARGAAKKSRKEESDDEDENDMSDNESPGSGGEASYKPTPSKRRTAAGTQSPPKTPPKKRGRAAATAAAKAD